jgi:hypothetical protein
VRGDDGGPAWDLEPPDGRSRWIAAPVSRIEMVTAVRVASNPTRSGMVRSFWFIAWALPTAGRLCTGRVLEGSEKITSGPVALSESRTDSASLSNRG